FFFFQAEDGIRDGHVTGVQTCALPIWDAAGGELGGVDEEARGDALFEAVAAQVPDLVADEDEIARLFERDAALARDDLGLKLRRSEERRVGKAGRRWGAGGAGKEYSET